MNKLENARIKINEIDKEIAKLFEQRMLQSKAVAEYKKENFLPILNTAREREVIKNNLAYIQNDEFNSYYVLFQQMVMDVSKKYQQDILQGINVAYSGVKGAYAHIASRLIFPEANYLAHVSFEDAYNSVVNGKSNCVVLPIENSFAGDVGGVIDLICFGDLYLNGIYELKISHSLLGTKDSKIEDIEEVISHTQAIQQCSKFISTHNFSTKTSVNTAYAAKHIAESNNKNIAAIASNETAELYGLKVLAEKIHNVDNNTTRFAVLSRTENKNPAENTRFIMSFIVNHKAGALAQAINIIGRYGFNMQSIKSRNLKNELWQYSFYVEINGNPYSKDGEMMFNELKKCCSNVKILGTYKPNIILN